MRFRARVHLQCVPSQQYPWPGQMHNDLRETDCSITNSHIFRIVKGSSGSQPFSMWQAQILLTTWGSAGTRQMTKVNSPNPGAVCLLPACVSVSSDSWMLLFTVGTRTETLQHTMWQIADNEFERNKSCVKTGERAAKPRCWLSVCAHWRLDETQRKKQINTVLTQRPNSVCSK